MGLLIDALWRATAYCLHPRVIALSVLPLLLMVALSFALGYFFWEPAVSAVAAWLQSYELMGAFLGWLDQVGAGAFRTVFAPLLVLVAATPLIVFITLLLVALCMTPAMVELVALRRFPRLERKHGGGLFAGLLWSLGSTVLALLAMILSMPLWLVPPLVLVLPPLIWGWLTYRVFAFDALATHASKDERRGLIQRHRTSLLIMGVVTGFLGAAPSLLWASGAMFIAMAPLLVPLAIWIYTLVFAFASLWFAHFLLQALERERALAGLSVVPSAPSGPTAAPPAEVIDVQARPVAAPPALPDAPISPLS
jgi:hypothetical protein